MLTPPSYDYYFMTFLILNLEYFNFNFSVHSISTWKNVQLHRPIANFAPKSEGCVLCEHKDF